MPDHHSLRGAAGLHPRYARRISMVQHVCTVYKTVISVLVMSYRADGGAVGGLGAGASQSASHVHEGT